MSKSTLLQTNAKSSNIQYIRLERLRMFKVNKYRDIDGSYLPFTPDEIDQELLRKEDILEKKILARVRGGRWE